jgi:hypothetical protein
MDDENIAILWESSSAIADTWTAACLNPEFLALNDIEVKETPEDIKEARAIVFNTPNAPEKPSTPGAAMAVRRLLQRYDFSLQDETQRLRTYAVTRLLELAESEKENIALGALEKIGKIAEVGLFETKISVDIGKRSTEDLEEELKRLMGKYVSDLNVVSAA